ncbi:MAG TPA: DUF4382 domain-containing protein [Gemmatimonadales bacterium]|nr:DUF4382 domain-containing protein [Gemmatimonadales bacterium]
MRMPKYLALTLAAGLVACEGTAGPQMSHVFVRLTDAPAGVTAASAWISTVYLIGGDGTSRDTITTGPSTEYDLLSLQGGVTDLLGDKTIPAGDYDQLRLVVDSAMVLLDGETTPRVLKVPSGMQTGIKVEFGGPVHILPGRTDLLVDFDVSRSFIITGPTPPRQVLFKPVIHGVVTDQSGSISGTSNPPAALGLVFAIIGTDTVTTDSADATTGAYSLPFLPAGTYKVLDSTTVSGFTSKSATVTLSAGQHATQDFTLQ